LNSLKADIENIANLILDDGDKGHFFGGILRLAAHDFMDYDQNDASEPGGSDGCLDLDNPANAGLSSIWCEDDEACPFSFLYELDYSSYMSKADFWVAGATKVVEITSVTNTPFAMPFRYGRIDNDNCPSSSSRLPADSGCTAVEGVFIDRMGLTWTDATALLGGHTLGRGDAEFSGHPGTWVDTDAQSTVFDKRYYRELLDRGWRPRFQDAGTDWVWGGAARDVMMLNADICLAFDIPDGNDQTCCTNIERNCREFTTQCATSETVRPEAYQAVHFFNDNNQNTFYNAFQSAWIKATENGIDNLQEVSDTCTGTTSAPTSPPTSEPVSTPAPTSPPTPAPTSPPTPAPSPNSVCEDVPSFIVKGRERKCGWVVQKGLCYKFGYDYCPSSCGHCQS